jgi:hypothetical protein
MGATLSDARGDMSRGGPDGAPTRSDALGDPRELPVGMPLAAFPFFFGGPRRGRGARSCPRSTCERERAHSGAGREGNPET